MLAQNELFMGIWVFGALHMMFSLFGYSLVTTRLLYTTRTRL